VHSQ
jgi:hypothetical protein